jgi:hypothetical protein
MPRQSTARALEYMSGDDSIGMEGARTASTIDAPSVGHVARRGLAAKRLVRQHSAEAPAEVLVGLAAWIRQIVRDEIGVPDPSDWIDQYASPLGKRRHLELVRAGLLKGRKDGKTVYVRRGEIDAYLEAHAVAPKSQPACDGDVDRELKLLGFEVPDDEA